jgi:hypothetical protein
MGRQELSRYNESAIKNVPIKTTKQVAAVTKKQRSTMSMGSPSNPWRNLLL